MKKNKPRPHVGIARRIEQGSKLFVVPRKDENSSPRCWLDGKPVILTAADGAAIIRSSKIEVTRLAEGKLLYTRKVEKK